MQLSKTILQKALTVVKPGLANSDVVEQATAFAFVDGRVVTFNDEISISHPVVGLEAVRGAIEADKLYMLLAKLKHDEIDVIINSNNELVITSGRARAGLTLQAEITLPLNEDVSARGDWHKLPDDFIKDVDFVMTSCSKDLAKPILMCVHVNAEGYLESSDGFCITHFKLKEALPVRTFLLPATSATHLVRFNPTSIAEGQGWIHFRGEDDAIFSCRIYADSFPDTAPFLNMNGVALTMPKTLNEVIDRAWVFAKRERMIEETLTITLHNKRLKVRAEADTGWFEEEVNIHYDGEDVYFAITPYLLKNVITATQQCTLGKDKLKFEGENWLYVTALREVKHG